MSCVVFVMSFCCFKCSSWWLLWSVDLELKTKNSLSASIVPPLKERKFVVSCSVCRSLFGDRTSHREVSSQSPAWQRCLSLLLSLKALHQVWSMPRGVLWSQHVRTKSSLICLLAGIKFCCVVKLRKKAVRAGIIVAPLGAKQYQDQGWEIVTSLRRGALSMWLCASCCACSWSSGAKQNPFFLQQVEERKLSEPHEVAAEIWKFQSSS